MNRSAAQTEKSINLIELPLDKTANDASFCNMNVSSLNKSFVPVNEIQQLNKTFP
jgi:hypothetical protein